MNKQHEGQASGRHPVAGIERVPRVVSVRHGRPMVEDQRVLKVANVIWCTGFNPGFSWIDLLVHAKAEQP